MKRPGLILGLVALAFSAMSAIASAHTLTNEAAGHVEVPLTVELTSTNMATVTAIGSWTCEHVKTYGIVEDSGATSGTVHIADDSETPHTATGCPRHTPLGTEEMFITPTFETLHLATNGTNIATFSYQVHFPKLGNLTCNFASTVAAGVVGGNVRAEGEIKGTSPEPCPKGGNFSGTFSLSDEFGFPLTLD